MSKKVVTFGEIMMRLSTPGRQRFVQARSLDVTFGGGEANVAAALANLGFASKHVTCLPDNDLGRAAAIFFQQFGVDFSQTVYRGHRLGLYFLENGASLRPGRIIYDRFESAFALLDPVLFEWKTILQDANWFHWTGITPAISGPAAEACGQAIEAAQLLGIPVSADINYRRNLWQYGKSPGEVIPDLIRYCTVLICTRTDAEEILGIRSTGFQDMAEQVLSDYPQIRYLVATERETVSATHTRIKGLGYSQQTGYFETTFFDLQHIADRIGGGDAFAAGYIFGLLTAMEPEQALRFATATSALKHTTEGDFSLSTRAEVEQILAGNLSGRLLR